MPAAIRPSMPKRRPSGRRRPFVLRSSTLSWVALVVMALAFLGGIAWQRSAASRAKSAAATGPTPEEQAAARRLLESAVTARYADQPDEALRLAREARETDPMTPGAATFIAELALRQGRSEDVDTAARDAVRQGLDVADAKLLLALTRWMQRAETSVADAGAAATQLLEEASAEELSNGTARFFAGDLQRAVGRPGEAHRSLLGGLHRQEPWHSSALLAAKLRLVMEEGGQRSADIPGGLASSDSDAAFGAVAYDMHRAARDADKAGIAAARAALQGVFTSRQLDVLSSDSSLVSLELIPPGEEGAAVPFAAIQPPKEQRELQGLSVP